MLVWNRALMIKKERKDNNARFLDPTFILGSQHIFHEMRLMTGGREESNKEIVKPPVSI